MRKSMALVCPVVCLTDGVGCVGAGLALSEGNEDKNDSDIDDDGSDGGRRPGAISQNIVSCRCRPFVEVVLILTFYLGVPLGFVILWYDICFLRVYMCMYVIAHNRTICPCHRQHYMLLTSVLPRGVSYTRTTPSDPTRQREHADIYRGRNNDPAWLHSDHRGRVRGDDLCLLFRDRSWPNSLAHRGRNVRPQVGQRGGRVEEERTRHI